MRPRASSATSTVSRTVSSGNSARGLERPAEALRARRAGPHRETSSPWRRTVPVGRHEAADRVHQRRLAGAVGADQADDLVRSRPRATRRRPPRCRRSAPTRRRPRARRRRRRSAARCRALEHRRRGDTSCVVGGAAIRRAAHAEQRVACRVGDLHEAAGEVEQEDQQPEARREQRHQLVVGEERGQADHPQRAEHRAHRRGDAADHDDRDQSERVGDQEVPLGEGHATRSRRRATRRRARRGPPAMANARSFVDGRAHGVGGGAVGVVAHRDRRAADARPAQAAHERQRRDRGRRDTT